MTLSQRETDLLDLPGFAKLATLLPDGSPHLTIMWYHREGDTLRMVSNISSIKARNILRDSRVAVVVDKPDDDYDYIRIQGRGEIVPGDAAARDEFRLLARRYMGEAGDAWTDQLPATSEFAVLVVHVLRSSLSADTG